jgi:hypothetical protein
MTLVRMQILQCVKRRISNVSVSSFSKSQEELLFYFKCSAFTVKGRGGSSITAAGLQTSQKF